MLTHGQKESLSQFLQKKMDQGVKLISSKDLFEWCKLTGFNKNAMYDVYDVLDQVLPIFRKKMTTPVRIYRYGEPMVSKEKWNPCELPLRDGQIQMGIICPPKKKRLFDNPKRIFKVFGEMYRVLCEGAHLYCWSNSKNIRSNYKLIEDTGFVDLQLLTVLKETQLGTLEAVRGDYYRGATEYCILACKPPIRKLDTKKRNVWWGYFKDNRKPVDVEEDWIRASTSPFDKVLYVFSGVKKNFKILDRELILVDKKHA